MRTVSAGDLAVTGYGSCKVTMGVGCVVGTLGAVNVGVGLNESLVGLQKVGYAMSSEGYPIKGTAIQEYTRLMNNQGYSSTSSMNSAAIFNPISSAIIALGGTEQDYNDFSFLTGLVLGATSQHYSIYKPYYEAYAASRMYGNQVNNTNIVIPETYYNIRAEAGYLGLEAQRAVTRTYGNIINPEYISTADPLKGQYALPRNLNEQIFYESVKANPLQGRDLLGMNNDPNFSKALGFQKMEAIHELSNGKKIIIHYQYRKFTENNQTIEKVYDMKFIGERPE